MPSPSSALQRPDLGVSMEEFDVLAAREGYIADQVAPVVDVALVTANIGKIPLKALLAARETRRAPGGGYSRAEYKFEDFSYACEEHGTEEVIDDRNARIYARYFDAEQVALKRAQGIVLRNREQRMAALVFNATTFAAQLTTPTNEWDDLANATPIEDVNTAREAVFTRTGLVANALILNGKVFQNLTLCDQVLDHAMRLGIVQSKDQIGNLTAAVLARLLFPEVPDARIIVAGGVKNSANPNATASPTRIWSGEYGMVARIANSKDPQEPCLARSFHFSGDGSAIDGAVESYRDESVRGDVIRVRHDTDELIMYTGAGQLLDNLTT